MWRTDKLNNIPLCEEEVKSRFNKYGFKIIEYNYKNNSTRMLCEDSEGYLVKVNLGSLGKTKTFERFSLKYNKENFIFNANHYAKLNDIHSEIINAKNNKKYSGHIDIKCKCECGNIFNTDFNSWRRMIKTRCKLCVKSISNYEMKVMDFLKEYEIEYIPQYKFKDCKDKRALPFDFYLPNYNICIEVDGEQHFGEFRYSFYKDSKYNYENRVYHDEIKNEYCNKNNIKLIRIPYYLIINNKYKQLLSKELHIC